MVEHVPNTHKVVGSIPTGNILFLLLLWVHFILPFCCCGLVIALVVRCDMPPQPNPQPIAGSTWLVRQSINQLLEELERKGQLLTDQTPLQPKCTIPVAIQGQAHVNNQAVSLAQMVEHVPNTHKVVGSIPTGNILFLLRVF
jgi:hypothetical protein